MVKTKTLGKISIGLLFPVVGMGYLLQNRIKRNFFEQSYYSEAIDLFKGYNPGMKKLGQPIEVKKIDLTDPFNYQDNEKARLKIPISGKLSSAEIYVYAIKNEKNWNIESMELKYKNCEKFKFYDSSLTTKDN